MTNFSLCTQILTDSPEKDIEFILGHSAPIRITGLPTGTNNNEVRLIDETRQHSGSFKYRGAILRVNRHPQGVVACGSGNFPIAVGQAASTLGVAATLVMPGDTPAVRREKALSSGSEVLLVPGSDFVKQARQEAEARGLGFLDPFRDTSMLVGCCSLGVELAQSMKIDGSPDDAVVIACGRGSLAAGTALGLRMNGLENDIYVAEPEHYRRLHVALKESHPVKISPEEHTICDALRVTEICSLAFVILQKAGVRTLVASEAGVVEAQERLACEADIQAEPSGAVALAAASEKGLLTRYRKLWVIVSGGNA